METNLNRNEKLIALLALGAILIFASIFIHISYRTGPSVSQIDTRSQINYQMARPDEGYSEYSLNGREVELSYAGLTKKEIAPLAQKNKSAKASVPPKADLKKTEAAKKQALAQTQAQARAAQARAAQSAAQARQRAFAESQAKRAQLEEAQRKSNDVAADKAEAPRADGPAAAVQPAQSKNPAETAQTEAKKKKKTFAEWRALIFAQPTQETVNSFVAAYRKGEVTSPEFQALAQDLIDQNDDKLKGLGLYALRSTPSLASFSQMVHVEAEVGATYKTYIQQAYLSYLQPQNVGYLNQALMTKDKTLILKSLNLLGVNLQKVTKGDFTAFADPRNGRESGTATPSVTMSTFSGLIPALNTLGASQDQELAPLAQQIISYIQSTNTVAQN